MKLRTVINELTCQNVRAGHEELLDEDVLLTPTCDQRAPSRARLVRLCRQVDYDSGAVALVDRQIALVFVEEDARVGEAHVGDAVWVTHAGTYEDFRMSFLDLPAKVALFELRRERMFEAFLGSYDLTQLARRTSEVLGNPVIITNTDQRLLATAGDFPLDAPDVQEVLTQGYVSETVSNEMEADGVVAVARRAHHSVLSATSRFGHYWVTSIIYRHHLEMGRYDVMEKDHAITGFDLELIDYAGQLAGIMIDRLGMAGERVGAGSSVLSDLMDGTFANDQTMRTQVALTELPLDVSYVMVALHGQSYADRSYYAHTGALVARTVQRCLWCARDDLLCVLIPVGKTEAVGYDDYLRAARRISSNTAFSSMLVNNGLRAFVSEPFRELDMATTRFSQCRALVEASSLFEGKIVYFWEHRFVMLAAVADSLDQMEMMLDKRVIAMMAYDREHGTSYMETAVMSVCYPGSPAEAADALSVHRNTYFYRMNRVKELFYLDLKDGDDRLAVAFSSQVVKGLPERYLRGEAGLARPMG